MGTFFLILAIYIATVSINDNIRRSARRRGSQGEFL